MQNITSCLCKNLSMRNMLLMNVKTRCYAQHVDSKTSSDNNLDLMRNRLIYQSRKRGTLENCIIFSTFADKYIKTFSDAQLQKYDSLINSDFDEWELYAWAIGSKPAPKEFDNDVTNLLKDHVNRKDHYSK